MTMLVNTAPRTASWNAGTGVQHSPTIEWEWIEQQELARELREQREQAEKEAAALRDGGPPDWPDPMEIDPANTPVALTSAAAFMEVDAAATDLPGSEQWHPLAFAAYRMGEIRSAVRWHSAAIGLCDLEVARVDDATAQPVRVDPHTKKRDERAALALWAEIFPEGQSDVMERAATLLYLVGEFYVVSYRDFPRRVTRILARGEIQASGGGKVVISDPWRPGHTLDLDPGTTRVARVWQPLPETYARSDSPVRAALPLVALAQALEAYLQATASNRLVRSGLLKVPHEATFPDPHGGGSINPRNVDEFVTFLVEAFTAAVREPMESSSVAPIVATGPGDALAKIELLTVGTPFAAMVPELLNLVLRRIAVALDMPTSRLLGEEDSPSRWAVWANQESSINNYILPTLRLLAAAFAKITLWPELHALGINPYRFRLIENFTRLAQKPDQGPKAAQLYQLGLLNGDETLRLNGIDPRYRMTEKDYDLRQKWALASAPPNPTGSGHAALNKLPPPRADQKRNMPSAGGENPANDRM